MNYQHEFHVYTHVTRSESRGLSWGSCILQYFPNGVTIEKKHYIIAKTQPVLSEVVRPTICWWDKPLRSLPTSTETAPRHARQVPHPVPLRRGRPLLHQHWLSAKLPPVARGKEPNDYRFLSAAAAPAWFWEKVLLSLTVCCVPPVRGLQGSRLRQRPRQKRLFSRLQSKCSWGVWRPAKVLDAACFLKASPLG